MPRTLFPSGCVEARTGKEFVRIIDILNKPLILGPDEGTLFLRASWAIGEPREMIGKKKLGLCLCRERSTAIAEFC